MVGKLESVQLREIWKHEAYDFTGWVFENCDVLNEQLGLSISPLEKEKSVGPFNVDILAEDTNGRVVIIENQLTKSDHDHLGKLLTYMTNLDAKIAIWISTDPRPEHVTAINYLNEVVPLDTHFYLLKLQAFRIGDSDPAPLFTVEAGPSEDRIAGGEVKKEFAEHDKTKYSFFEQLLSIANKETNIFSNVTAVGYQNWLNAGTGKGGLAWSFVAMRKNARVELLFCHQDAEVNKSRYHKLLEKKEEIEETFREKLQWDFKESRKQQYIRSVCPIGSLEDKDHWSEIQIDMVNRLVRLENALGHYIRTLL